MILSRLSIHGFKSFARKTELRFDGGITAVVGPNGCGKTNIVDAIRWGLGEQRPSVLRADRMENIIFGGTQSARPLGMAEVSIVFDNSRHILPIDYNEVVVTRRLYRSGESEYLLNKTPVRLKDITDLFMDTGIGADAYSVIELKMVEDILSDKAEDRRKLLEEAAGVTKYKHRLKAAVRKLDATQNDLVRVNDIIQEVERNVRSLKRQVQKARRYQELREEIRELDIRRSGSIYRRLQDRIKPLRDEIQGLIQRKDGRTTEITTEEAGLESIRLKLAEEEKSLSRAQEALGAVTERLHHREGDIRVGHERISSLQNRIERNTREVEELRQRLSDQKTHLEVARRDREALQVRVTSTGRIFQNKKKELEVFLQGLNLRRLDLNEKKREIIDCLEAINRLGGEESQFRARVDNNRGRLERLEEEDGIFQQDLSRVETLRKESEERCRELSSAVLDLKTRRGNLSGEDQRQQRTIESIKERIYRDQSELDLMEGRMAFLTHILENLEGMTDGAKKLIRDRVPGLVGILADLIQADPKYRLAIEAGLGEAARYLLVENVSQALDALDHLKQHGGGNVTLVALDRAAVRKTDSRHPVLPAGIRAEGWADEFVTCDRNIQPAVHYLLGDLLIVPDREAAGQAIASSDSGVRAATLEGELLTGWGAVQAVESAAREDGIVGRRQRIEEIRAQITKIRQTLTESETALHEAEARREALQKEGDALEKASNQAEERFREAETRLSRIRFEAERAEEGLKRNARERDRLLQEIEAGREGLENLRPKMEALVEKRETIESLTHQIQAEVERLEDEERVMEEEVHKQNLAVVRFNGEAKNLDYDLDRSERLIAEIEQTIRNRMEEISESEQEIATQKEEVTRNESVLIEEIKEKETRETARAERETAYHALRAELQEKEKEIRHVRRDREEASERIHAIEMEISEFEHQARLLVERIRESYETDLTAAVSDPSLDTEEVESMLADLREKVRSLGPVNLVALKEYDQEQERLDFLLKQRDDLLNAEQTLHETIKKINHTARTRFSEVFTEVCRNFQVMFERFFQGGEADLRLTEGEDPLDAPVEIMARPAGKQLRDIALLSGGEKALTAISLLFALYMVKPSPFCILDEVDAPLDDANVERFTRVLAEYAQKTQFVLVSHNKMTMKAAEALYGVTMEEEGISRMVSVKFEE
ncbi:MAG TPA: chromosome segregation protein SMC [bacterium]|nr:chromosome segregation protein SMC [bacterium]